MILIDALKFISGETVQGDLLRIAIDLPKFRRRWFSQSSYIRFEMLDGQKLLAIL